MFVMQNTPEMTLDTPRVSSRSHRIKRVTSPIAERSLVMNTIAEETATADKVRIPLSATAKQNKKESRLHGGATTVIITSTKKLSPFTHFDPQRSARLYCLSCPARPLHVPGCSRHLFLCRPSYFLGLFVVGSSKQSTALRKRAEDG